ncbi:MAG: hypothetical protein HYX72_12690 [Acidobacteria bacterium]|nr:hypothetical protein [Acidobacteriota bacterium]
MSTEPQIAPQLSQTEKMLLARGAALNSSRPNLDVLVKLCTDEDPEIRAAAADTLARLSDAQCNTLLSDPALSDAAARFFLDPEHFRPSLLQTLLRHPATPQDVITELAAKGDSEIVAALLQHLDLLKTPALAALKQNPAAPAPAGAPAESHPQMPDMAAAAELVATLGPEGKLAMARGEAEMPALERICVLVLLASDADPQVSAAAQSTLGSLDERLSLDALAHPSLPPPVARYFLEIKHARVALLPVLLCHPNSPEDAVTTLVSKAGRPVLSVVLEHLDELKTSSLIALKENPAYLDWQKAPALEGYVMEVDLLDMLIQEIESGETPTETVLEQEGAEAEAGEKKEEGVYSKIAKLTVAKKVVLALRGNREERAILIRDGSKVVSRAVLSSPKLTDAEIENFAALKNVSQDVLRLISMNRKFMKDYVVVKNLLNNPRLPLDVGLTLLNRLIPQDLRFLTANRDVSETLRKMADKSLKSRGTK